MLHQFGRGMALCVAVAGLSGCVTTGMNLEEELAATRQENKDLRSSLDSARVDVSERDQKIASLKSGSMEQVESDNQYLPPDAKPGECYARVWVPATYKSISEQVLVKEASSRIEVIPASYETVQERILVSEASSQLESVPAVYGSEQETVKVRDSERVWRLGPKRTAGPASEGLLAAARAGGAQLDSASVGMCFHEHYRAAQFETETKDVLVRQESSKTSVSAAEYRWIEKQVLVKEASTRLEEIPAAYAWSTEQVVDKPAHTIWKKGTGPIQRIDEATGEIMCLVEVPATYKSIRKRVLQSPATTRTVEVPAVYKTVRVRELVAGPAEDTQTLPAQYQTVQVTNKVADATHLWHEVHDTTEPKNTRTGAMVCLDEIPAQYKTVNRTVVVTAPSTRQIDIPAEYKTVSVNKVVTEAQERRIDIPAEYETVTQQELGAEGFMEWRSILCETNMTNTRISHIQTALRDAGYNPGPIDGAIGTETISAVNAFQRAKGLPVDKYLNVQTLEALGVSAR